NAMSSYFGTTKLFDKSDFCILERDTTHLTYELGRYLFGAGVVSEILENYSEILITENGKIDVGAALSVENGPSAEGEGSQYSGAVNGDVLAVIREVIASPDEFRQSVYTVDPVDAFIEKASGINWNPEGVSGEEEILGALAEQIGSLCGNEIESFGLSMAEYESKNDYTALLRATHGYSIIEKKFTVHNHVYEAVVTEPTCTERGFTTYTCSCGASYVEDYVEAAGHSFENGICTVCGEWEYPMGDINLDGEVNVKDAYYARLVAAKLIKPTDEQRLVGDVDLDGRITALDANIIRKFVAHLIEKLPVTG
ncbi:MAG: dockerin type I repeat-containing protein, partial [Oscillospiraceae bacterium]|nr:dockerin type I repeat-containing protein [Oscillospiraceae bacterium]